MAIESQGTVIAIESSTTSAVTTVTAAVGYPTIITKASHGLTTGDVGTLTAFAGASAASMNSEVVMIEHVTASTFSVPIDTTGGTLTGANGTFTPDTFTTIGDVVDWDGPGGTASIIDTTNLASTAKEKLVGLQDEGQFTLGINWDNSDVGQAACRTARTARTLKGFKVTYSDATIQTFDGYVMGFSTSGGVDDKVNGSITIEISGAVSTT